MNVEINNDKLVKELGITEIKDKIRELEDAIDKLSTSIEAAKSFKEEYKAILAENKQLYEDKVATQKSESERLQNNIAELKKSNESLSVDKATLEHDYQKLKDELMHSNNKVDSLAKDNAELRNSKQSIADAKAILENDNQSLKEELTLEKEQNNSNKELLSKQAESINSLNKTISELNTKLSNANIDNAKLFNEKEQIRISLDNIRTDYDAIVNEKKQLEEQVQKTVNETNELKKVLAQFQMPEMYAQLAAALSDNNKENLELYMPTDDKFSTFARLLQEETVNKFYRNVKNRIQERKTENLDEIIQMLKIVFGFYAQWKNLTIIEPLDPSQCTPNEWQQIEFEGREPGLLLFGYKDSSGTVKEKAIINA